jgi:hypothetical protein
MHLKTKQPHSQVTSAILRLATLLWSFTHCRTKTAAISMARHLLIRRGHRSVEPCGKFGGGRRGRIWPVGPSGVAPNVDRCSYPKKRPVIKASASTIPTPTTTAALIPIPTPSAADWTPRSERSRTPFQGTGWAGTIRQSLTRWPSIARRSQRYSFHC